MSEKEIFDFIHKQVNALSPLLIECDKQKLQESKRLFDTFVSTLSEQAANVEKSTQKDIFTIALCALCSQSHKAKATLLEALRIHFKEPSKRKQQEQFISRYTHLQERIKAMKALMQKARKQLEDIRLELENLTQQYTLECARFWGKMKSSLGLSKTKKLIINTACKQARAQRALLASAQIDIYTQARKVALPELMRICDGANITLDSTQETATYTIALHNKTLQLIDIPSFTDEKNLSKETARALQQAHCVLLVVSDTIKDSTLNMIKQGLGEQAQVYVLLDKSATPNTLKPIANDTSPQEKAVIQKLKDSLGQSYAGARSIYTLPALLSQASCLIASHDLSAATQGRDSLPTQEIQDHFLSPYKDSCSDSKPCQKQRLSDDSGFSDLAAFLASIIVDSRASTQQACDNAYALLQELAKVVDKIASNYEEFFNAATHSALAQSFLPLQEVDRLSHMISYGLIAPITQIQEQIHSTIRSYAKQLPPSPALTANST